MVGFITQAIGAFKRNASLVKTFPSLTIKGCEMALNKKSALFKSLLLLILNAISVLLRFNSMALIAPVYLKIKISQSGK
jgi:hypothetical protein